MSDLDKLNPYGSGDGDTAGRVGSTKASKLLDTVSTLHIIINTPDGLGPKDLKSNELRRLCT